MDDIQVLILPGPDPVPEWIGTDGITVTARKGRLPAVIATDLSDALGKLRGGSWAATIVSLGNELVDEAVLARIATAGSAGALLLSTPHASLRAALLAERIGAIGMLPEPLDATEVAQSLRDAVGGGGEVPLPDRDPADAPAIIGESRAMAEVFSVIARVARSDSTVLITGESGTGKEVVARTLHAESDRARGPFVAVNCAAIPENLLESELFGHEKGAFTGAVAQRQGRFERAEGGTLFLDEIGDMSLVLQAKVLRALEERRIEPVGGRGERAVDVRVLAATNTDLDKAIQDGRFREDLYFRLGVVEIALPALRERGDDVTTLALHVAAHFSRLHGRPIRALSRNALARLRSNPWPGNVRELRNVMDRAVLLTTGEVIRSGALRLGRAAPSGATPPGSREEGGYPETASLAEVEADHIQRVLAASDGQIGRAAATLGIHRNTLGRKVQEYGLDVGTGGRGG